MAQLLKRMGRLDVTIPRFSFDLPRLGGGAHQLQITWWRWRSATRSATRSRRRYRRGELLDKRRHLMEGLGRLRLAACGRGRGRGGSWIGGGDEEPQPKATVEEVPDYLLEGEAWA